MFKLFILFNLFPEKDISPPCISFKMQVGITCFK